MEKIKKVFLIVNPVSGDIDKEDIIHAVQQKLYEINASLNIYRTTGKNDREAIKNRVNNNDFDRIIIAGGDGTIKLVAEALMEKKVPMGIIPVGSANGLAANLGIPADLKTQLKIALGGHVTNMDILNIDGEVCLHISDLGVNAELIKNYQNSKVRGKLGYLLQSVPTLMYSKYPFEFEIQLESETLHKEGILLAFANAKKYGTGANVNPQGRMDDGVFEILIYKNFDIPQILNTLRNETNVDAGFVEIIQVEKARVICKKPVACQVDGEYMGEKKEVNVNIIPHKLPIMSPVPL
ncbi:lipid kinase, YegS/Rv2252/BmrU family [Salegentibacter echinorum]|uniref:Lipid kinase, YegS/Rv2252/BmrU family n=1 Tax=Salegentibacter echinorum TaxID=1073325 RepID=A0A1M5CF21_SALEC|nr:YegS/Rv2252/BmrU family lipid kinase [Salegentibacter echinorum]SHF53335.1 lipid kinase, YegS/Rv2252/BmrU family [Salegentibacter echinorum]